MFFWVQSKIAMEHAPLFVAPFLHCYSGNRSFPEGIEMDKPISSFGCFRKMVGFPPKSSH